MPAVTDAKSVLDAHAAIMLAVASTKISIDEGESLGALLAACIKLIETAARIEALERKAGLR
jgi:hypothetical protein